MEEQILCYKEENIRLKKTITEQELQLKKYAETKEGKRKCTFHASLTRRSSLGQAANEAHPH